MKKDRMKRICIFLLVVLLALASLSAGSSYSYDTKLDVYWTLDPSRELFRVGFSNDPPALDVNRSWVTVNEATSVNMIDRFQNNAINYVADGSVYAYWNVYSNNPVTISLSASGPLKTTVVEDSTSYSNLINWKASWQPMVVDSEGRVVEASYGKVSIGRTDNDFSSMSVAEGSDYVGVSNDYAEPKELFTQLAGNYPMKSKYGFAKIEIETQNTKSSEVAKGCEKVRGNYSCYLHLDVIAR